MIKILRTDSNNPHFIKLVRGLDAELAERDGDEHAFYDQFNKITHIKHVVVVFYNDQPVGCGAIKQFDPLSTEVKRMYTESNSRGKGLATIILQELEKWAKELGYQTCILETGKRQPEAIALYLKNGYASIPNYGQYENVENSICFEKRISI